MDDLKRVADLAELTALVSNNPADLAWVSETRQIWEYDSASDGVHDGAAIIKPTIKRTTQLGRWILRGTIGAESVDVAALTAEVLALFQPGQRAVNVLRVASDVVSATTVTIGDDVYEIEIVNTDSTDDTADGDFDEAEDPIVISAAAYPGTTWAVGILIRVESEILRVTSKVGDVVTLARAQSGTTAAAHADAEDIFKGDGIGEGSTIAVGLVTTLTPAAFTPALVADITEHGTEDVGAVELSENEILLTADEVGAVVLATTETLAGANNGWAAVAMFGGRAAGPAKLSVQKRVPTAVEIALAAMHFAFDFEPVVVSVQVYVTATPGVAKAWDGSVAVVENVVTLADDGAENLEATDTVVLTVTE